MKTACIILLMVLLSCRPSKENRVNYDPFHYKLRIVRIEPIKSGCYLVVFRGKYRFYERQYGVLPDTFKVGKTILFPALRIHK